MILQEITVGKQTKKNEDPKVTPDSNNHLIFEKASITWEKNTDLFPLHW